MDEDWPSKCVSSIEGGEEEEEVEESKAMLEVD